MIQPDLESLEVGEGLVYLDRKTGVRYMAKVLEADASSGRVRVRVDWYEAVDGVWRSEGIRDLDTSVGCLFRVGGKRRTG